MPYANEAAMYPAVMAWLTKFVPSVIRGAAVVAHDTHATPPNLYVRRQGLQGCFDTDIWQTFEVQVDVTGFVRSPRVRIVGRASSRG
jgi:hypothetical protein